MERLRPHVPRRASDEQGFSLVELLVVVIIIGVLAAIAIPVYLSQRQKALDSTVKSDLRNAATFQIAYASEHGRYVDPVELLESDGWKHNSQVDFSAVVFNDDQWFCLEASHDSSGERYWTFDSVTGEFFVFDSGGNCPIAGP